MTNSLALNAELLSLLNRTGDVGDLPQPFAPKIDKLPATLQGTLSGSATVSTTFEGKKGQRLIIEAEARRIGSAANLITSMTVWQYKS